MILTIICAVEPATGKTMMIPACELYRTPEQATRNVLRREYESGIATWTRQVLAHPQSKAMQSIPADRELF